MVAKFKGHAKMNKHGTPASLLNVDTLLHGRVKISNVSGITK